MILPSAPDIIPVININIPLVCIPGFFMIKLPMMYKINIYINPVTQPVSHPFSLLFLPLKKLAVIMLIIVIETLIGDTAL